MRAVLAPQRYAGAQALRVAEVPAPVPGPGELLVRVHAASVNDWDWGLLQPQASRLERLLGNAVSGPAQILGCDFAGQVEDIGPGVHGFQRGDAVYGDVSGAGFGAFAQYLCVRADSVARVPATMTYEQAAAIPQAGMLAVQGLLDVGRLRRGEKVLVNGAGGGVGTFALQIAKLHDADVTVVDRASKLGMLRALGADRGIDFARCDFTREGVLYDLILDARATRSPFACARALAPGGRYVTVGGDLARLLQVAAAGPLLSLLRGQQARVVSLKANKDLGYFNALFEARRLRPVIDATYTLDELAAAFARFASGEHHGKIVVKIP